MRLNKKKFCTQIFCLILISYVTNAQVCTNKYSAIVHKSPSYFDSLGRSIFTKNNEIISVGKIDGFKNNAAHIVKFSEKGTPLWSYGYTIDYFNFYYPTFFSNVKLNDVIELENQSFLVSGSAVRQYKLAQYNNIALLAKIDKYGNVIWSKSYLGTGNLAFTNIIQTKSGDIVAYLATDNGKNSSNADHSYSKIVRFSADGVIKWSTLIFTYLFDAGGLGLSFKRAIMQANDNSIVVGDVVYKTKREESKLKISDGNLHFYSLDYNTGKVKWESSYQYPIPKNDTLFVPDIVNVSQQTNGNFSFITSLYLPTLNLPLLTKKSVSITTDQNGKIKDINSYYPGDGQDCKIIDMAIDNSTGNNVYLIKKGNNTILANIDGNGKILWDRGYKNGSEDKYPPTCISPNAKGFNIFMSDNKHFETRLLITDFDGAVKCLDTAEDLVEEAALLNYGSNQVSINTELNFDDRYDEYFYPLLKNDPFFFKKDVECQENISCCTDVVDSGNISKISICEGKTFMLPDSTIIKDSGIYYVRKKNSFGCDSINFFAVTIDKNISKLSLGKDTCMLDQNTIIINATAGYKNYLWGNNGVVDTISSYKVVKPGNYRVTVKNACGQKTDSIIIYEQCDYIIYMPKAFTPNNDGLNDIYRVSSLNKNQLISLKIFNRWGKLIFETNDPNVGWNGTFHNEPLPSDSFTFLVNMKGLSGNMLQQRGSFILIR